MMDGMGEPNGDQADGTDNGRDPNDPDDRRRAGTDDADPLGRPPPTRDAPDTSRYRVPQAGELAASAPSACWKSCAAACRTPRARPKSWTISAACSGPIDPFTGAATGCGWRGARDRA